MCEQLLLPDIIDERLEPWTITIVRDDSPVSPRDDDNLGKFFVFNHNDYVIPELKEINGETLHDMLRSHPNPDKIETYLNKLGYFAIVVSIYDHSGISIFEGYKPGWDTSWIGFYVVSKEDVRAEYNVKRISKKIEDRAYKVLRSEIKTFDQYMQGDVYGFVATKPAIEEGGADVEEFCYGFYGDTIEEVVENMLSSLPAPYKSVEEAMKHVVVADN